MGTRSVAVAVAVLAALAVALPTAPADAAGGETPTDSTNPPPGEAPTGEEPAIEESVRGTLKFEGEPVVGAALVVESNGEEVGRTTTGDDGTWELPVPGPGTYEVTLDTDTLPDGVDLRDPDKQTLELPVRDNQRRSVVFALGERTGSQPSSSERFFSLAADGVKLGSIIALAAVGLSLIFGITGLINFAHGELVTFGALVAWFFNASVGGPQLPLIVAAVLALVAGGLMGGGLELGLWRSLRRRKTGRIQLFVISIGLALFLRHIFLLFYGPQSRPYDGFALQDAVSLGPVSLPPRDFIIIGISLAVLLVVGLLLQGTRLGTAMRAVADNRDLAEASGINVQRVILMTWIAGTALAALGGVFQGLSEAVRWNMGFNLLLLMFSAVILGGLGTAYGAMVGGLLIGIVIQVSTFWFSTEFKLVFALAVMVLVLLARPQGILGRRERIG